MESTTNTSKNKIKYLLETNLAVKIIEIFLVFFLAFLTIVLLLPLAGENLLMVQGVIWIANIIMLITVWLGLKIRGQNWEYFGLAFRSFSLKEGFRAFLLSILVFILAMLGFIIGSIIMANITGIPPQADMSSYEYLQDNIPMLMLSLIGVYIVSSLGEEVVYRAFLINRLSELGVNFKYWNVVVLILSAIIFGFAHYSWGPMGIVQTTFMGLVLGICYLKLKKKLWILVIAHAYMDTILLVQIYLANN